MTGRILSLQVGKPQTRTDARGKPWTSAINKSSVDGPVWLGLENVEGDTQANRKYHGGPDKAVCSYSSEHYPQWRTEFDHPEMAYGSFGENLTLADMTENLVCIGDVYEAPSGAQIQVCQPRVPCVNVRRNWSAPKLPARMEKTGFTGFYSRVLKEGMLAAGDTLTLIERPCPDWNVLRANAALYGPHTPEVNAERTLLCGLAPLSKECVRHLKRLLRREEE